jgi:hypothetical protein
MRNLSGPLIRMILAAALIASTIAQASVVEFEPDFVELTKPSLSQTVGNIAGKVTEKARNVSDKAFAETQSLQLGLIMIYATTLGIAKQRRHKALVNGEKVDNDKIIYEAVHDLLSTNEVYAGLLGMKLTDTAVRILSIWLEAPQAVRLFSKFLATNVSMLVSFGGFELFAELLRESTMTWPESEKDQLQGLFLRFGKYQFTSSDRALIVKMAAGISDILIFKPELRALWLENTIRLRIVRPEMAITVALLATCTVLLATAYGLPAAFIGGLIGATLGAEVPTTVTEPMTSAVEQARAWMNSSELNGTARGINLRVSTIDDAGQAKGLLKIIKTRAEFRSSEATALFERYAELVATIESTESDIKDLTKFLSGADLIQNGFNKYVSGEMTFEQMKISLCGKYCDNIYLNMLEQARNDVAQARVQLRPLAAQILSIYNREVLFYSDIIDAHPKLRSDIYLVMDNDLRLSCAVATNLRTVFGVVSPEIIPQLNVSDDFTKVAQNKNMQAQIKDLLNYIYLRKFDEWAFLNNLPRRDGQLVTPLSLAKLPPEIRPACATDIRTTSKLLEAIK